MATAFVTGASRGIGKAIAVHLARAGYDVALTARTVAEGEAREHSSTLQRSDTSPLPGSLESTADLVQAEGVRCMTVPADLTDRSSVIAAAKTVLAEWGPVDVLVNNGRYVGPGHMDRFIDTPLELLDLHLEANVMAPLALSKEFLPGMIERGSGVIVNISSGAGYQDPHAPAGDGGWGLGYGMSKGALQRVAGIFFLEMADNGIRSFNVDASTGAPPDVVGAVVAWLVTDPDAAEQAVAGHDARNLEAQDVCRDLGLLPGWPA
jgi:NAD(P)-dependent dehydrogenase (short-subunit alcohol dehydrogenase family)